MIDTYELIDKTNKAYVGTITAKNEDEAVSKGEATKVSIRLAFTRRGG